jgi:hypothetical protein
MKFPRGSIVARNDGKPGRFLVMDHRDQITTYFSLSTFDTHKQVTVVFENRHYLVSEAEAEE